MKKQHIPLLILALAVLASTTPSWAVINNGGGSPGAVCGSGREACLHWCVAHNHYGRSIEKCMDQCDNYWCGPNHPATNPVKGINASPINGKPVEAPPPQGSKPVIAAPIVNGKPVQAAPGAGPTDSNHPILERGEGHSSGKH